MDENEENPELSNDDEKNNDTKISNKKKTISNSCTENSNAKKRDNHEEFYMKERRTRLLYNTPYDVENWCNILQPKHTFETFYFDLSYQEALSITIYYRVNALGSKKYKLSQENEDDLKSIYSRIEKIIKANPNKEGYFARLSTRSPKDACLYDVKQLSCIKRMKSRLLKKFYKIYNKKNLEYLENSKDTLSNQEYCALMVAACESLRCRNTEEIMELLLFSERVYVDIMLALDFKDLYEKNPMRIILRKWWSDIPYRNEFRGFVYNGKLTALSQYDNFCYFPKLEKEKDKIGKIVKKYFDEIIGPTLDKKGYKTYVCDFGVRENYEVCVIELNSFDDENDSAKKGTGSACFDWKRDLKIMKNGPYEFRITEKPPFDKMEQQVSPDWMRFIKFARKEAKEAMNRSKCIIS